MVAHTEAMLGSPVENFYWEWKKIYVHIFGNILRKLEFDPANNFGDMDV